MKHDWMTMEQYEAYKKGQPTWIDDKLAEFETEFAVQKTTSNPNNLTWVEEARDYLRGLLEARNSQQAAWLRTALEEATEQGRGEQLKGLYNPEVRSYYARGYQAGLKRAAEIARGFSSGTPDTDLEPAEMMARTVAAAIEKEASL